MQYTCVKVNDNYVVRKYLGNKPKLGSQSYIDWEDAVLVAELNQLPTLPEHQSYWATMDGKVFGEDEFEIGTDWDKTDAQSTTHDVAIPYLFKDTIPKQQEQDLWDEFYSMFSAAIKQANPLSYGLSTNPVDKGIIIDMLKHHYMLTKKTK